MTRDELVELLKKILSPDISQREQDSLVKRFRESVPHPEPFALIADADDDRSLEEIVDECLNYRPISL